MRSTLLSRRDLDFLLYEWLDVEALTSSPRYQDHSRETFDGVLDLSEQLATRYFATHNKLSDAAEPTFDGTTVTIVPEVKEALDAFVKADLMGAGMDYEAGGLQLPATVTGACFAWFQAANVGTAAYPMLTIGNANLLLAHGTPEQIETYAKPLVAGRFFGTMCLSEPQAGSSLGDIVTRAEPQADGSYRLFGNKMWISGGEHDLAENIVHLVLAKIPGGPEGTKGISLFIVPKVLVEADGSLGERNDVTLTGLNHKMGYRGTTNTVLAFGDGTHRPGGAAGAVGHLVGEAGSGLTYMFHMMNEARIGVGLGATALGYTGYLKSVDYARQREQGRPVAAKDPAAKQVPIVEHADVKRMLLAQKSYVEGALALEMFCMRMVDEQRIAENVAARNRIGLLLDILTPIAKSWPSQWCLEANSLAIQVHGGYGYTREYDVEQHYRDNRLNPIHEGTHGIQGLDLLGRKVTQQGGISLRLLTESIGRTITDAAEADDEFAELAEQLGDVLGQVGKVTAGLFAPTPGSGDVDVDAAMANSSVYLEVVGHLVIAWIWLEQMLACEGKEGDFYDGKRQAGRYFFRYELPRTGPQLALLAALDRTTLDMRDAWF
ncbi:acyl-CoA dehydrogenase [Rhodococcus spelaei]|uniref:Acyl-CoA dehydrogenase n=1 Tax=Rhodococcus spelaei TaxID=2546320 RepID=A0A541B8A8_9NOCA|nr:acyl-CoA dehydrogenase [Rhodococcus spelaei]TQF68557.1 acyl-CoA dehydrogenase [Rhodococcus spelaei]